MLPGLGLMLSGIGLLIMVFPKIVYANPQVSCQKNRMAIGGGIFQQCLNKAYWLHQLHLQQSPVGLSLLNTHCGAFVGMVKSHQPVRMDRDPKDAKNSGFGAPFLFDDSWLLSFTRP